MPPVFLLFLSLFFAPHACNTAASLISQVGVEENSEAQKVLPPWTPLKLVRSGNSFSIDCWGRTYTFAKGILPSQILSQGENLLESPAQLTVSTTGNISGISNFNISVIQETPAFIVLKNTGQIGVSAGKEVEISAEIRIEYDGLVFYSMDLSALPKNTTVSLMFPIKREYAKYYLSKGNAKEPYSGALDFSKGNKLSSSYRPYFWIGDEEKGLFWFCETAWKTPNNVDAISVFEKSGVVYEQLTLVNTSNYEFGIQATPVKPLPSNWREHRFAPVSGYNLMVPWPNTEKSNSERYFGWPEPNNPQEFQKIIDKNHAGGVNVLTYAAITRLPGKLPYLAENNWVRGTTKGKVKNDELIYIYPSSNGYAGFIAGSLASSMRRFNFDGYYLDGGKLPSFWRNQDNKKVFPIMAYRSLQRALYDSVKTSNPNALIITHMSANLNIPVLAYVDGYVDGEQFRTSENGKLAYIVKDSYLDNITLGQFKAEFIGKQWGIIPFFLPEFDPSARSTVQPTLGLASLLLVHDVQPWPIFSNVDVWNKMYGVLDSFGFVNSTFIPYYGFKPPGSVNTDEDVFVSAYKKGNQSLLIVSNLSKNQFTGKVSINKDALGINKISSAYNVSESRQISLKSDQFDLQIDPLSYKFIWLK